MSWMDSDTGGAAAGLDACACLLCMPEAWSPPLLLCLMETTTGWHCCRRGCVAPDTVAWVRQQAARLPRVPSLAFVHIPLPQMAAAWNSGAAVNGSKGELVGCPGADSGFFAAARSVGCEACGIWAHGPCRGWCRWACGEGCAWE